MHPPPPKKLRVSRSDIIECTESEADKKRNRLEAWKAQKLKLKQAEEPSDEPDSIELFMSREVRAMHAAPNAQNLNHCLTFALPLLVWN